MTPRLDRSDSGTGEGVERKPVDEAAPSPNERRTVVLMSDGEPLYRHRYREQVVDAASDPPSDSPREKDYARPSGYRKGVRDEVWRGGRESDTGRVRDPQTGQFMAEGKPWDMGHKPGFEFRKHQQSAMARGIDRKQFLDEHNDARHYRPELPSSNRNRLSEDVTDDYFGD